MEKDYSLYIYYKGSTNYPNKKAEFFGLYERAFELTYKGSAEDKEEAFKDYMAKTLYEKCSEAYCFGATGVDQVACFQDFLNIYFHPDLHLECFG